MFTAKIALKAIQSLANIYDSDSKWQQFNQKAATAKCSWAKLPKQRLNTKKTIFREKSINIRNAGKLRCV